MNTARNPLTCDSVKQVMIDVGQVAELLNCSNKHVYRLVDLGRMPRPMKLGRLNRWRHDEIEAWIKAGCPKMVRIK